MAPEDQALPDEVSRLTTTNSSLRAEVEAIRKELAVAQVEVAAYRNRLSSRILDGSLGRGWRTIRRRLLSSSPGFEDGGRAPLLSIRASSELPEAPAEGLLTETTAINSFTQFAPGSAGPVHTRLRATMDAANLTLPLMVDVVSATGGQVQAPIPIGSFVDTDSKKEAATRLKALFDQHGSDKATLHDYHLLYGPILAGGQEVERVLEIGIGTNNPELISNMGTGGRPGASLRAFRDYLPDASIFGADVDQDLLFEEDRIKTFFVDQTKKDSFEMLGQAVGSDFDLIIDDGLHALHTNLTTLLFALENLKVGGWFVVEDIVPVALPAWQVVSALLPSGHRSKVLEAKGALMFVVQVEGAD